MDLISITQKSGLEFKIQVRGHVYEAVVYQSMLLRAQCVSRTAQPQIGFSNPETVCSAFQNAQALLSQVGCGVREHIEIGIGVAPADAPT